MKIVSLLSAFMLLSLLMDETTQLAFGKSAAERSGDYTQILIPTTAYAATFLMKDPPGRGQFYRSFFTNLGLVYTLKYSINRIRPGHHGRHSFPSGHTAVSFQGATFLFRRYGWKIGLPAYLAATYVGWSRIEGESDKHYVSDVIAGAVFGTVFSWYFTHPRPDVTITPVGDYGYFGVIMKKTW